MFKKLGQIAARSGSLRSGVSRAYHPPEDFKPQTMDDLPVPEGCWQTHNAQKQRKYNARLLTGVISLLFTLLAGKQSGLFFFNWGPPELKKE